MSEIFVNFSSSSLIVGRYYRVEERVEPVSRLIEKRTKRLFDHFLDLGNQLPLGLECLLIDGPCDPGRLAPARAAPGTLDTLQRGLF